MPIVAKHFLSNDARLAAVVALILILAGISFAISLPMSWIVLKISHKLGALDTAPLDGQVKADSRSIPNTGGIAIVTALLLPMIAVVLATLFISEESLPKLAEPLSEHLAGLRSQMPLGVALIGCILGLHILGLIDDRKPLGPWIKLLIMLVPGLIFAAFFDTRLMTMFDTVAGGTWLSILMTVFWFAVIINAMNFIDNMDGLSGGIALIASSLLLVSALMNGQWFVGAVLGLLAGSVLGFLVFNFPPAKLFMGDGGSLVIGLLLAFLTTRTTYVPLDSPDQTTPISTHWYALLMPVVVLAIPLYDFVSVTTIRIVQGKSPFVGDMQHFSHRIRDRGLGARSTILVIYALTLATGISGILISRAESWQAILIGVQILALLGAIALFEYRAISRESMDDG
jgi:UDP-GlcNAc:undecaprenyl-phosphate/decaprenyl-phosphate GlcNAc-1-phosphate transferase